MRLLQQDARAARVRARIGLRALGAAVVAALVGACADRAAPLAPVPAAPLRASAVAQVQTTPALTWLAPLGTGTADPATFDAAAAPVVEVCAWTGTVCAAPPVARFTTGPVAGELPLTVNTAAGQYEASWSLMDASLTSRRTYRLRVLQGTTELGAVSVDVVRGRWALTSTDGSLAPLQAAGALPLRFSIQQPAPPPNATLFRDHLAVGLTGNAEIPVIVASKDGAVHSVLAGTGPWGVGGALLMLPDERTVAVYAGPDGLPGEMVIDGVVLAFHNYTATTVDIRITRSDGATEVVRSVPLGPQFAALRAAVAGWSARSDAAWTGGAASAGLSLSRSAASAAEPTADLARLVNYSSLMVSSAVCLATPSNILSLGPVGLAMSAASCGLTLYSVLNALEGKEDNALANSVGAILSLGNVRACLASPSPLACIESLLEQAKMLLEAVKDLLRRPSTPLVSLSVSPGSALAGDPVTLTFSVTASAASRITSIGGVPCVLPAPTGATSYSGSCARTMTFSAAQTLSYTASATAAGTSVTGFSDVQRVLVQESSPPSVSLTVSPSTVQAGAPVAVTYTVSASAETRLTYVGNGVPGVNGPPCALQPVLPANVTEYTASCTATQTFSSAGAQTYAVTARALGTPQAINSEPRTLTITAAPPPTVSLAISPSTVRAGAPVAMTYTVSASAATRLTSIYNGVPGVNGIPCALQPALPASATEYTASCTATQTFTGAGTLPHAVTATALGAPQPTHSAPQTLTITAAPPPTVSLAISPATVQAGAPVTVTYTVSAAAATRLTYVGGGHPGAFGVPCAMQPALPANATSYSASCTATQTFTGAGTQTYGVTAGAFGAAQGTNSTPQTLTITPAPPPTVSLAISPSSVQAGAPVTVTYTVTAAAATRLTYVMYGGGSSIPCALQPAFPGNVTSYTASCSVTQTFTFGDVGTQTYSIFAMAFAAAQSTTSAPRTLTITPAPTPTVSLAITPSTVQAGVPVTITYTVTAAAETPLTNVWAGGGCALPPLPANSRSYRGSCSIQGPYYGVGTYSWRASASALGAAPGTSAPQTLTVFPAPRR